MFTFKPMIEIRLFQESGSLSMSISPEDLILHFFLVNIFCPYWKYLKEFFFLGTSSEYLTRYGQGSVFKIRFQGSAEMADPCLYFFEYSPDVLKN